MSASELGTSSAPAIPCSPRDTMKPLRLIATAQSSEVTPKPISPMRRITIRPSTSESEPASRISAPSVMRVGVDDPLLRDQTPAEVALGWPAARR